MEGTMTVDERIEARLREGLRPARLEVRNDSDAHEGHVSSPGSGTSHYTVTVVSELFEGLGRLERQRLVYRLLEDELAGPIHALALVTRTPAEDAP